MGRGGICNSERCLKWGSEVIKQSQLKLLKRREGKDRNCT